MFQLILMLNILGFFLKVLQYLIIDFHALYILGFLSFTSWFKSFYKHDNILGFFF